MRTYVVRPRGVPRTGILLVHDIFGFTLPQTRRIADGLAARGHLVAMPDFYDGEPFTPPAGLEWPTPHTQSFLRGDAGTSFGFHVGVDGAAVAAFKVWRARHPPTVVVRRALALAAWFESQGLRATQLAAIGFCWGGRAVHGLLLNGTTAARFTAGAAFYGHVQGQSAFGAVGEQAGAIRKPLYFAFGGGDEDYPPENLAALRGALEARAGSTPFSLNVFPEQDHGFAHRYAPQEATDELLTTLAATRSLVWLEMHLASPVRATA